MTNTASSEERERESSHEALERLAAEQAALRRVATLVARESSPVEIFAAVTDEARHVLATEAVGMLRIEAEGSATLVAQSRTPWDPPPLGTCFPLDGENLVTQVIRTGEAARQDDWTSATGSVAAMASVLGVRSSVATPIVVEGELWGVMVAATSESEPLPRDTESRIGKFTELVGMAIANAQARGELSWLVEEEAALRRVATLVAGRTGPDQLFAAVAGEVQGLIGVEASAIVRFEDDGTVVTVGTHGGPYAARARAELDPHFAVGSVRATGRAARFETDDPAAADMPAIVREVGIRSAVANPIVVEGELWGAMIVAGIDAVLPPDTEERLEKFTELVATAIANAQSREDLQDLADEQAALGRVATLVAGGVRPEEVFQAVANEVGVLFGSHVSAIVRFEEDGTATVLGDIGGPHEAGARVALDPGYVVHRVRETSRSARFDTDDPSAANVGSLVRTLDVRSALASPIVVEGALWGAITAASLDGPLAPRAESRLNEFTALVATAIANANSREALGRLADEQAALRRVAELVAREAPQPEVFTAVAAAISGLLGEELRMVRYEGDDAAVVVAGSEGGHNDVWPVGVRMPLGGNNAVSRVFRTGEPARIDDYRRASGPIAEAVRSSGLRSVVATPIAVEGRVWGAMLLATFGVEPVPLDTERRLGQFTELMATAIANAEARAEIQRLAEEQAALRRVATLVAEGRDASAVFDAVCEETGRLVGATSVNLSHYTPDAMNVTMAGWSLRDTRVPPGSTYPLTPDTVGGEIVRTREPVRIDTWEGAASELATPVRARGARSSLGAPVMIEGQLWGALVCATDGEEPLPAGTEFRLGRFTDLVATAVSNAAARSELIASRARLVAAGDEARKRIERNLHDGTQQRLIAIGLDLQRVQASVPPDQRDTHAGLEHVAGELESVLEEVRELSRGLHPPLLSRRGLGPSLRALARRSPIPVELEIELDERPPEPVETAVYYVVSEALTNAIRYSNASTISVMIGTRVPVESQAATVDGRPGVVNLYATVGDDGEGGALPATGSGLTGLADRIDALGGRFALQSPRGRGTTIWITLPLTTP